MKTLKIRKGLSSQIVNAIIQFEAKSDEFREEYPDGLQLENGAYHLYDKHLIGIQLFAPGHYPKIKVIKALKEVEYRSHQWTIFLVYRRSFAQLGATERTVVIERQQTAGQVLTALGKLLNNKYRIK